MTESCQVAVLALTFFSDNYPATSVIKLCDSAEQGEREMERMMLTTLSSFRDKTCHVIRHKNWIEIKVHDKDVKPTVVYQLSIVDAGRSEA